jgi:hypothetical protein
LKYLLESYLKEGKDANTDCREGREQEKKTRNVKGPEKG